MKNFWSRFPLASEAILKNLNDESLAKSKEVSREIFEIMDKNGRVFWIRSIKNLNKHFQGYEESWKQVVNKAPVAILKQLAIASHKYFEVSFHLRVWPSTLVPHRVIKTLFGVKYNENRIK